MPKWFRNECPSGPGIHTCAVVVPELPRDAQPFEDYLGIRIKRGEVIRVTSFKEVVDGTRERLALHYLRRTHLIASEIAFRLGVDLRSPPGETSR